MFLLDMFMKRGLRVCLVVLNFLVNSQLDIFILVGKIRLIKFFWIKKS